MKEKALVLSVSKWEIDGNRGGKISWCVFDRTTTDQKSGVEILSASCPFETLSALPSVPCVAELDLSISSTSVNGRAIAKVVVSAVRATDEKSFSSNCMKINLQA